MSLKLWDHFEKVTSGLITRSVHEPKVLTRFRYNICPQLHFYSSFCHTTYRYIKENNRILPSAHFSAVLRVQAKMQSAEEKTSRVLCVKFQVNKIQNKLIIVVWARKVWRLIFISNVHTITILRCSCSTSIAVEHVMTRWQARIELFVLEIWYFHSVVMSFSHSSFNQQQIIVA